MQSDGQRTDRQELGVALIVVRGVVHGKDMDEDGSAGRDGVAPDLHIR